MIKNVIAALVFLLVASPSFALDDGVVRVKSAYPMAETVARRHGIAGEAAMPFRTASGVIASIASSIQKP